MFLDRIDLDAAVSRARHHLSVSQDRLGGKAAMRKHDLTIDLHHVEEDSIWSSL